MNDSPILINRPENAVKLSEYLNKHTIKKEEITRFISIII